MFGAVTLHGPTGSLLWGYRSAATLTDWRIVKEKDKPTWKLTARVRTLDTYQSRQRPLLFTAPREGGRWCWDVQDLDISEQQLTATLGPPLQ
jgi:hypothetical protein